MRRLALIAFLIPGFVSAQEPKIETRSIVLHAAAASVPALKYALVPDVSDLKPGTAALLYQRAHSPEWWQVLMREESFSKFDWFAGPLESFPKEAADKVLQNKGMLKEIDVAARRTYCDWELHDRIRADGAKLLVPDTVSFRQFGILTGIRTRRALADKKFGAAAHSLQSGFALCQHIAEGPTLINYLVAVSVGALNTSPIEDWVQMPDSPNLYWPLTNLPSPLISLRRNLQGERMLIDHMFPGAREALRDPSKSLPADTTTLKQVFEQVNQLGLDVPQNFFVEAWIALKVQKDARAFLIESGRTAAQVDALGQQNVMALYLVAQYERVFDDFAKLSTLPVWQAYPAMAKADNDLMNESTKRPEAMTFPKLLLPALKNVLIAQARLDRRIAVLRSFEAIRLHAAQNKGELLAKWDDLRGIPIPLDPGTGQPFDYRRDGDRAIMNLPALPGRPDTAIRYEISLKK
jgi:hypothetical protein